MGGLHSWKKDSEKEERGKDLKRQHSPFQIDTTLEPTKWDGRIGGGEKKLNYNQRAKLFQLQDDNETFPQKDIYQEMKCFWYPKKHFCLDTKSKYINITTNSSVK